MKRPYLLLLIGLIAFTPAEAPSCGPFFQFAFFDPPSRPAGTVRVGVDGRVGVIKGTYWLEFLIPAWRYLDGKPIKFDSKASTDNRETGDWSDWERARSQMGATPIKPIAGFDRVPGEAWPSYLDCPQAAFGNAARTLNDRIARFGGDHAGVKAWVRAQDVVFANCEGGTLLPEPAEPGLPDMLAADRRYQIAAAHFYAARFDEARSAFLAIAQDKASPWRNTGPYLAARCLIRKGTLQPPKDTQFNAAVLELAEGELRAIASRNLEQSVRRWATESIRFVAARLRPGDVLAELATELSDPKNDGSFVGNQFEFDLLWTASGRAQEGKGKSEMLDWLLAMRKRLDRNDVLKRWGAHKTAPWLVAALGVVEPSDPEAPAMIEAATNLSPNSPAYATAAFHRLRLSPKQPAEERRTLLDQILTDLRPMLKPAELNPFLRERFALAANFEELLRFAPRVPAAIDVKSENIPADPPPDKDHALFDDDATRVFNTSVPLSGWLTAASSPLLNQDLQDRIIRTGWLRAHLAEDENAEAAFGKMLRARTPEIAPLYDAYATATSPNAKQFAAVYLMLKTPGLRPFLRAGLDREPAFTEPSAFRDNWWCGSEDTWGYRQQFEDKLEMATPAAVSPGHLAAAADEIKKIGSQGPAAGYFARVVSAWAREHRDDPRAAEALHLSVRAARSSCEGGNPKSKEAFQTLHRLYPKSEWAKKTPYWY